jgi:phage gpG-like protein
VKLSLEVTGATEAAQLLATAASRLEQSPRPLLEILADALQRHLRSHIEAQTGPNGSWPALAPVTRKIREFYGYPPEGPALVRAGGLLQSITTLALQEQSVEVGTTTAFARTLQDGGLVTDPKTGRTRTVQAFPFAYITAAEVQDLVALITTYYLGGPNV